MIRVYFVFEIQKSNALFWRAKNEILYLNGEIPQASEDFIPLLEEERFEEELKSQSEENYCLYNLFKIFHFIEVVHSTKILKMGGDFIKDDQGLFWLINISRVQYKLLENNQRTEDIGIKGFVEGSNLPHYNSKLDSSSEDQIKYSQRKESIDLLNNIMLQYYELLRKPGNEFIRAFYEDDISDETFIKIHPNAPFRLSELLKSKISFEDIRSFVIDNSRQLQKAINHPGVKGIKMPKKGNSLKEIFQGTFMTDADQPRPRPRPVTATKNVVQTKPFVRTYYVAPQTKQMRVSNNDFKSYKNNRMNKTSDGNFMMRDEALEFPIARSSALTQENFKNKENEKEDPKMRINNVFRKTKFSNGRKSILEYLPW